MSHIDIIIILLLMLLEKKIPVNKNGMLYHSQYTGRLLYWLVNENHQNPISLFLWNHYLNPLIFSIDVLVQFYVYESNEQNLQITQSHLILIIKALQNTVSL